MNPCPVAGSSSTGQGGAGDNSTGGVDTIGSGSAATTGSASDLAAYAAEASSVIRRSRSQLAQMVNAISGAHADPANSLRDAEDVLDGRRSLLSEIETANVPVSAEHAQHLLVAALRASIRSDTAYASWIRALALGHPGAANAAYQKARANDPVATDLKRRLLRALNQVRAQAGLVPVPTSRFEVKPCHGG